MRRAKIPGMESNINITPLVDVVLVLLIIFMVIAPKLNQEANMSLPATQSPPDKPQNERQITVTIDAQGQRFIDDEPVDDATFSATLQANPLAGEDAQVVIKGDAGLTFGNVSKTMAQVEAAGFSKVGLITRQQEG